MGEIDPAIKNLLISALDPVSTFIIRITLTIYSLFYDLWEPGS